MLIPKSLNIRATTSAAALAALLAGVAGGGVTGCSLVHVDCTTADVAVTPVHARGPYARVVITATVTSGGKPLVGAPVNLWVHESGPHLPANFSESIGTVRTGINGVARLDREKGFFGLLLPGRTVTGYYADFVGGTKVGGVSYCGAKTPAQPVRCGAVDTCGPIPPISQGLD